MARKTTRKQDIGARETARAKGSAVVEGPPPGGAELEGRIERLEIELEQEGPDAARGVRGQPSRSRSGRTKGRR